jgi:hypothetical protein
MAHLIAGLHSDVIILLVAVVLQFIVIGVLLRRVPSFGAYSGLASELRRLRESNLLVQQENINLADRLAELAKHHPIPPITTTYVNTPSARESA